MSADGGLLPMIAPQPRVLLAVDAAGSRR